MKKKLATILVMTILTIVAVPATFDISAQAETKVRKVEMPTDFLYTKIEAPSSLLGMKESGRGIAVANGEACPYIQYGEKGNGARLYARGMDSKGAESFWHLRDWVGNNVAEEVIPEGYNYFDIFKEQKIYPGETMIGADEMFAIHGSDGAYDSFCWYLLDFTDYKDGDYADDQLPYRKFFYIEFDSPFTSDDYSDIWNFIKDVNMTCGG